MARQVAASGREERSREFRERTQRLDPVWRWLGIGIEGDRVTSQPSESAEVGAKLGRQRLIGMRTTSAWTAGRLGEWRSEAGRGDRDCVTQSAPPATKREGSGKASVSTMHLAKGLEFRAVVVMACDDEIIPLQSRIEAVADDGDLEEVYKTERHLLYVACTRARDHLVVTSVVPASEFLDDLRA